MKTAWTEKCFNSTLVQLKEALQSVQGCQHKSFNSTLVQLKDALYRGCMWSLRVSILP